MMTKSQAGVQKESLDVEGYYTNLVIRGIGD